MMSTCQTNIDRDIVPLQPELSKQLHYSERLLKWNPYSKKNLALCYQFQTGRDGTPIRLIPDACIDFLFKCDRENPVAVVSGVQTAPRELVLAPDSVYFGFKPYSPKGMRPLGAAWHELTDAQISLEDDLKGAGWIAERLAAQETFDQRIAAIADFACHTVRHGEAVGRGHGKLHALLPSGGPAQAALGDIHPRHPGRPPCGGQGGVDARGVVALAAARVQHSGGRAGVLQHQGAQRLQEVGVIAAGQETAACGGHGLVVPGEPGVHLVGRQQVDIALPGDIKAMAPGTGIGPLKAHQRGGAEWTAEQAHLRTFSSSGAAAWPLPPMLRSSFLISQWIRKVRAARRRMMAPTRAISFKSRTRTVRRISPPSLNSSAIARPWASLRRVSGSRRT